MIQFLFFILTMSKPDLSRYFDITNGCFTRHTNLAEIINYDQGVVKQMAGKIYDIVLSNHYANHEFSRKHYQQEFYKDIFTEIVLKKLTTRYKPYTSRFESFFNLPGQFLENFATESVPLIEILWLCEAYGDYDQINDTFQYNDSITKLIIDNFELTNSFDQQTPLIRYKACIDEDFLEKLNCGVQFNFIEPNNNEKIHRLESSAKKEKQNAISKTEFARSSLYFGEETFDQPGDNSTEKVLFERINPVEVKVLYDKTTDYLPDNINQNDYLYDEINHFNENLIEVSHNTTEMAVFYGICALLVIIFGMLSIFKIKKSCKNKGSYTFNRDERNEISMKNSRKKHLIRDLLEEEIKVTEV